MHPRFNDAGGGWGGGVKLKLTSVLNRCNLNLSKQYQSPCASLVAKSVYLFSASQPKSWNFIVGSNRIHVGALRASSPRNSSVQGSLSVTSSWFIRNSSNVEKAYPVPVVPMSMATHAKQFLRGLWAILEKCS